MVTSVIPLLTGITESTARHKGTGKKAKEIEAKKAAAAAGEQAEAGA